MQYDLADVQYVDLFGDREVGIERILEGLDQLLSKPRNDG